MSMPKPVARSASSANARPTASGAAAPGKAPVPVSSTPNATAAARRPHGEGGSLVIPTETGEFVTLREPIKTVSDGDEEIELRSRPPEERERRKQKKNLIIWGVGLVVIAITLYALLAMGPL